MRKFLTPIAPVLMALVFTIGAYAKPTAETGSALLKPNGDQAQAALLATRFLTRFHYKAEPLDTKMSQQIFDRYFDALDADRLFFVQSDVDHFAAHRDKLGDEIYAQDLTVPFQIFNLYEQRVAERTATAREQLKKGFDFSQDESYNYERTKVPWAKSVDELNDLWRKRAKNDWLRLKLAGKDDAKIRDTLDKRYANYMDRIRQLNAEDVFQTFMNAYAMAIEPHTNYLGPRASENFDIAMRLSLEGIGAVLQRDDDYTAIREIVPGGPAALSGKFKVGDRIVGVGQGESGQLTDVIGWRLDDVVDLIRGAKDTTVRLEVLPVDGGPDGKHQLISLVRKKVAIEEQAAKSSVIDVKNGDINHKIGVISLPTFYEDFEARRRGDKDYKSATRDVGKLIADLKKQNIDGIVVDLRNNGGGSLSEAIDLTGLFIGKESERSGHGKPVVQVRNANGRVEQGENIRTAMAWDGPLEVLVNRNSASASEIFAAAIQDYGRGLIVGEPTYGKGTVQNLVDLDQMSQNEKPTFGELKMTIQQFFRVNGGSTQLRGVTPDISFPVTADFDQNGEQAFDNALPWTSITASEFAPTSNLKTIVPMLETRHDARTTADRGWKAYQADVEDLRKLRKETTISLNEAKRRAERDEQERKHNERHPKLADAGKGDTAASAGTVNVSGTDQLAVGVTTENTTKTQLERQKANATQKKDDAQQDDGLQADERSLQTDLAAEKARKKEKDVVLNEASHILADEIDLIRGDTKLAALVLPHPEGERAPVN